MNNRVSCILVLFVLYSQLSIGQINKTSETASCWFSIMLEEDMDLSMGIDPGTFFALAIQRPDEEAQVLMDKSFELLREMLTDADFKLLDKTALESKVQYSKLGYPLSSLKKAAKKGSFDQYVKVEILVSAAKKSSSQGTVDQAVVEGVSVSQDDYSAKFFPQVDVTLKFANKSGEKIGKLNGRYRHTEKVGVNVESLSIEGFSFPLDRQGEVIPYYSYLKLAIEDLIDSL